nr:hypothetical protein [Nonomuraea rhodomycinica]
MPLVASSDRKTWWSPWGEDLDGPAGGVGEGVAVEPEPPTGVLPVEYEQAF